jgi:O-antigen/teichoic acid export membrane protein
MMTFVRRVTGSAAGPVFAGRAVSQAGIFVLSVAPVLVLATSAFNKFTVALTLSALFTIAPCLAFQQHLARVGLAHDGVRRGVWLTVLLGGVLAAVNALLGLALLGRSWWIVVVALGGLALGVSSWSATALAVRERFVSSAAVEASGGIAIVALTLILVAISSGVTWFAVVYVVGGVVAATVGRMLVGRTRPADGHHSPSAPKLVRGAVPLIVIGFLAMAYNRIDLLILNALGPENQTSAYAVSGRLVGPLLIALGSLNNSLYPQLLNRRDDPAAMRHLVGRYGSILSIISLAAVPCVTLIVLALGRISATIDDLDMVLPATLLALAVVPFALAVPYGFLLTATGDERWWMLVLAGGIGVDALAVATIAHTSATACALTWVLVQCGVLVAVRMVVRRLHLSARQRKVGRRAYPPADHDRARTVSRLAPTGEVDDTIDRSK